MLIPKKYLKSIADLSVIGKGRFSCEFEIQTWKPNLQKDSGGAGRRKL